MQITSTLLKDPRVQSCGAVSVYLPMKDEVQTLDLIKVLFEMDKKIYVPYIAGKRNEDMCMLQIERLVYCSIGCCGF